jgi:hypothetical protein
MMTGIISTSTTAAMQISSLSSKDQTSLASERQAGLAAEAAKPAAPTLPVTPAQTTASSHAGTADEEVMLSGAAMAMQRGEMAAAQTPLTYGDPRRARNAAAANAQVQYPDAATLASLKAAGIPPQPSFALATNPATGQTQVVGTRPDAPRIEKLINHSAGDTAHPSDNSTTAAAPRISTSS